MTCFTGVFLKKLTEYLYCTKSRGEMVSLSHFENVIIFAGNDLLETKKYSMKLAR